MVSSADDSHSPKIDPYILFYNRQNEKYKFSKRKVQKNPFFIKKTVGM